VKSKIKAKFKRSFCPPRKN